MHFKSLTLYTSKIKEQSAFYSETLGFQLLSRSANEFSIAAGETILKFVYREESQAYHYAFNIPNNAIELALDWLADRVGLLSYENELIQDFVSWKARAIYFYDCDKNIVEFIARDKMPKLRSDNFSINDILSLSEMGIVSEYLEPLLQQIIERIKLPVFSERSARFCALGNDEGLFICIDKNKKDWFPKDDPAFPAPFHLQLEWKSNGFELRYENSQLQIEEIPIG